MTVAGVSPRFMFQCGNRDGKTRPSEFASGTAKADAIEAAIERPLDVPRYPAQLLRAADERVEWIMDSGAASRLHGAPRA